jgi:ribosomal protein S18 acetylase RimI-like enzyme
MPKQPFSKPTYELRNTSGNRLALEPVNGSAATYLGNAMAKMDPWRTLQIGAAQLADALADGDDHLHRWAIRHGSACAGVVSIRSPWLYGPYLALLAVLPEHQAAGIGKAVLDWMESEARESATNLWACVSAFNARAQNFYERHGFERVAVLDDLIRTGFGEVLIRKRLR